MTKAYVLNELRDYAIITFGIVLYAMGVTIFMLPYGLTTGGVAGISSIIYYVSGLEVQVTYIAINICLLIAAIKILGIKFCLRTVYAVFLMTFMLWLLQRILEVPDPETGKMVLPKIIGDEAFMACVLGAIIEGVGLALCFEHNGSTGGTDIIAFIVQKYRQMSLGSVIRACDIAIISSCYFVFHDWYRVIYGFVMLFICSITLDYCIRRRQQSVQFMIFSRNYRAIADAIVNTGHGVTVLEGEGWYTHTDRKVVISVIRRREQTIIQQMIKSIDPYSFVSMTDASEVWGEGFDQLKVKKQKALKNVKVLVCATDNPEKINMAQTTLGDGYEIRSLQKIGCDTKKDFFSVILGQEPRKKVAFIKRFFGFDAFYIDKEGRVTLVQGVYEEADYKITEYENVEAFKAYMEKKK